MNAGNLLELPFLSPYVLKNERFHPEEDKKDTFLFYGRQDFRDLIDEILGLHCAGRSKLFFHGTMAAGKSHLLATAACYLFRIGKHVVYLADCLALVKHPVYSIRIALCLASADKPDVLSKMSKIKTLDDIRDVCEEVAEEYTIYFLVDQVNALDGDLDSKDRVPLEQKRGLRVLLDQIAEPHLKVQSSSANYSHGKADKTQLSSERRLPLYAGLKKVVLMIFYILTSRWKLCVLTFLIRRSTWNDGGRQSMAVLIGQALQQRTGVTLRISPAASLGCSDLSAKLSFPWNQDLIPALHPMFRVPAVLWTGERRRSRSLPPC